DLSGDETDAPNVCVAVFLRKAEALRKMGAHNVAVEHRHLTPVFEQSRSQDFSGRRFPCTGKTCEPETESLLVTRRMCFGKDRGDLGSREPTRQCTAKLQVFFAHFRSGDRSRVLSFRDARCLFVAILFGDVEQLRKRHWLNTDLITVLREELLRVIWSIEGTVLGVAAGAGVIAPDDEVIGSEVAADEGVPQCLTRSGHTHCQRQ